MNRRMRTRTYGGVRGRGLGAPSYSIVPAGGLGVRTALPKLLQNMDGISQIRQRPVLVVQVPTRNRTHSIALSENYRFVGVILNGLCEKLLD